jgi:hypothetical protein
MPWLGLVLLDTSCAVADLNPPLRVWQLFGGAVWRQHFPMDSEQFRSAQGFFGRSAVA